MKAYVLDNFKKSLWLMLITAMMTIGILQVSLENASAAVDTFTCDGIKYTVLTEPTGGNGTVAVTQGSYSGDISIPDAVTNGSNTYTVTSISGSAFQGCSNLSSVILPSSVTSIGNDAFLSCSNLGSVILPSSVTSIGNYAFCNCYKLGSVILPSSGTSIGDYAFSSCYELGSVVLPSNVTSIGNSAFQDCSSLSHVYFDGDKPSLGSSVFSNANSNIIYHYKSGSYGFAGGIEGKTCTQATDLYSITIGSFTHGTITVSTSSGIPGENIGIYSVPEPGYTLAAKYNDTPISGGSFIMPTGNVTITGSFEKIPVPTVNISSAETENSTPTWSWNDATGFGHYRYKLDNATIWTNTLSSSYTPQLPLSSGTHTLYVQEMNSVGEWSDTAQGTIKIDPIVTNLTITGASLSYNPDTTEYTVNVDNSTSSITVTPTVNDSNTVLKITSEGTDYTQGSVSKSIPLTVDQAKEIDIVATSNDGTATSKIYKVTVTRAKSSDATLSNLTLDSGTLSPTFAAATTNYTASVGNEVTSITVTPTVNEANATVTVNGNTAAQPVSLNVGVNTITVEVTAQDGTTQNTYTITVTRAASNDVNLSNITLSSGTLSPTFATAITNYIANVGNEVTSITVTPTVNEANATVRVNGNPAAQPVNLNVGANTITVEVTAQDGTTKRTYTITVTRATAPYIPPYIPPYTPPQPQNETRPVSIVMEIAGEQTTVAQLPVTRTLTADGSKKDILQFDESATASVIKKVLASNSTEVGIVVTDMLGNNADLVEVKVPQRVTTMLAESKLTLNVATEKAKLTFPKERVAEVKGEDISLIIGEVKDKKEIEKTDALLQQMAAGAEKIGTSITIESNLVPSAYVRSFLAAAPATTGSAIGVNLRIPSMRQVTLPIKKSDVPQDKSKIKEFAESLAMLVQHHDGENRLQKGTIEYDKEGNPTAMSIWTDKFGTFTLVKAPFEGKVSSNSQKQMPNKEWNIKFTKEFDKATINEDNIYVLDEKGNKVEVQLQYENKTIKVKPIQSYTVQESYTLYITKNVHSKAGKSIKQAIKYEFTIGSSLLDNTEIKE